MHKRNLTAPQFEAVKLISDFVLLLSSTY